MKENAKRKIERALLLGSLVIGLAGTLLFSGAEGRTMAPPGIEAAQQAWWGGLYPEYCLPLAMELVEGEPGKGQDTELLDTEIPVRLSFKYLTFLNQRRK